MKSPQSFSRTLALVAPVTALTLTQSFGAAVDYFLKIDGIKGESRVSDHKDSIDIQSFSWGMSQRSGGAGKASFQDFHFVMAIDKSSPKLMLACATGEKIPSLTFTVTKPTPEGEPKGYYTITLTDILISSYQSSGNPRPDGAAVPQPPSVAISARFWKIGLAYIALDGSVETATAVNPDWEPPVTLPQ